MKTGRLTVTILLTACMTACRTDTEQIISDLDTCIENSRIYTSQKEAKIERLKSRLLQSPPQAENDLYKLNYSLFEEFQSYQYDSAYVYATKSLELAETTGNIDMIVRAKCALVFCNMSSGLFLEAFNEMENIDARHASDDVKAEYYALYNRLYYDASDFNTNTKWNEEYIRKGTEYADSLIAIVPEHSYEHDFTKAQKAIKHSEWEKSIELYKKALRENEVSLHNQAIINSSIGGAYQCTGQNDSAMVYLAKAAINDIQSGTKETTALYHLAEILCKRGDTYRADAYIYYALADAEFYNARHRLLSINPLLPVIENARIEAMVRQRNIMFFVVGLCLLSVVILISAGTLVRKQNRSLKRKSAQLAEANKIKDEYIGHSFYVNSEFIAELEELYKTIHQKIQTRQFEDLRSMTKISNVNKRRERMYESFDTCFLNIFPSFVKEYSKLFPEGYIDPNSTVLTPEMRIFALTRLGITDSERIARFLNYSVHTVYTYKTRIKSKSIVSSDEFTRRIKAIEMN